MIEQLVELVPFPVVIVLLLVGFVGLIKGADLFVEGSSSVAKRLKVPSIIIGMTVVAMGTSLPETAVSVTASLAQSNQLAISNAVGSNIFNMMVVIGFCAVLTPVIVQKDTLKRDFPFSVVCALLLLGLGYLGSMTLGHIDGAIFLVLFAGFIIVMVLSARKASKNATVPEADDEIKLISVPKSIIFIILGGAAIALGGDLVVESATRIALAAHMSETLVGLTIVSIGTSLPELVTSMVAAKKKEVDMALGNAIGSNIFNILMVLGIASAISPIEFAFVNMIDIAILVVFSLIVWVMAWTRKKIGLVEGILMLALYAGYAVYICIR